MVNFLILLTLHFLGDFYLQTSKIAKCKNANIGEDCNRCSSCKEKAFFNNKYVALHSLLYAVPFLFLFFMTRWTSALIIIATLLASHYVIDTISCCLNKKLKQTLVFIVDQVLHIAIFVVMFKLFDFNSEFEKYEFVIKIIFSVSFLIIPVSVFINKLFYDLYPNSQPGKIFDVGSIIGMFERALVLIFASFGDFAAIAIIITIKTWARSNDLKDPEFRNKYLLGTLASLVLALIAFLIYRL
ncbi:MAG: DUF3307 domain-containing protein [Clostridia bacterium]|nr:DUF3307 domain-containing protein [Clostridia bacterium]MBR3863089.1 DUF3307 domain-containing protein [Clostridia bacterium]